MVQVHAPTAGIQTAVLGQTLPSRAAAGNVRFAPKTGHSDVTIWTAESRQELASTGVPTGIERQKRFGRFLSWLLETVRLRNANELGVGARAEN